MPDVAQGAVAITPSDTAGTGNVPTRNGRFPVALRANVAGNVKVVHNDDSEFTYAVAAGEVLPASVKRVYATGTTATGIAGWYY